MSGPELDHLVSSFRHAGLMGERREFVEQLRAAHEVAKRIRSVAIDSADNWRALLRFDLETASVSDVIDDLMLPIARRSEQAYTTAIVLDFINKYARSLKETNKLVSSLDQDPPPRISQDLCLGTWFRLLLLPEEFKSSRDIWRLTVEAAASEADRRNRSVLFLPDYAIPLVRCEKQFLSFHSYGDNPNTVHFKPSDFPRRVILDRTGYSGWSTLSSIHLDDLKVPDRETIENFYVAHKAGVEEGNISKYSQKSLMEIDELPDDFIFVALQVSADRTQALARVPMLEMLEIVVRAFKESETKVVVKRHPKCQDSLVAEKLMALADCGDILLTDASIHKIIPLSRGVCTVNSGVGSEAIVYLKPIYLFGDADYNCVAYRISTYDDFVEAYAKGSTRRSAEEMKRFLYYYRNVYQVDIDDARMLRRRVSEMLFSTAVSETGPSLWSRLKKLISRIHPAIERK